MLRGITLVQPTEGIALFALLHQLDKLIQRPVSRLGWYKPKIDPCQVGLVIIDSISIEELAMRLASKGDEQSFHDTLTETIRLALARALSQGCAVQLGFSLSCGKSHEIRTTGDNHFQDGDDMGRRIY